MFNFPTYLTADFITNYCSANYGRGAGTLRLNLPTGHSYKFQKARIELAMESYEIPHDHSLEVLHLHLPVRTDRNATVLLCLLPTTWCQAQRKAPELTDARGDSWCAWSLVSVLSLHARPIYFSLYDVIHPVIKFILWACCRRPT